MESDRDRGTILIVESDMALGKVMSRVLARQGLNVIRASHAAQALELAQQHSPRLALVDCRSRAGEGLKLIEELQGRYVGMSLIVLTDYPLGPDEFSPGAGRLVHSLTKPLHPPH